MGVPSRSSESVDRRAVVVALSLLAFGLFNVARIFLWGAKPLWAFMALPPIVLLTIFGWLAFASRDRPQGRA